jgi:hypothetical protein
MLLFRHINNEALDEDRKAQREVIARTQKQVQLFSSETAVETSISRTQLNELKGKILQFANALNYATNEVQKSEEIGKSVTVLQERYDNMALYMASIPFTSVVGPEQKGITDYLDSFLPQLVNLSRLLDANTNATVMEKEIGREILAQFNDQTYNPIGSVNVEEESPSGDIVSSLQEVLANINGDMNQLRDIANDQDLKGPPKRNASAVYTALSKIYDRLNERLEAGDYETAGAQKAIEKLMSQYRDKLERIQEIYDKYQEVTGAVPAEETEEEGLNVAV